MRDGQAVRRALRRYGPPVIAPVTIPNEEALYQIISSIDVNLFHLSPVGRRLWRGAYRTLARELSRRGVQAPGSL